MRKKNKKRTTGPVIEIIALSLIISIICFLLSIIGISGYKTEAGTFETALVIINNIFTKSGLKNLLNKSLINFQSLEPLILLILSLIAISILESSGLLKHVFSPLKKVKSLYLTAIVVFVGIISTIVGDYSYALLLPLSGILYKYAGKSSSLGIITMFVSITIGYGTGIFYNYQMYQLGNITELSASGIINNYNYELLSNIFILIVSTVVLSMVGTIVLEKYAKKYSRNEETDNLTISKKAGKITAIVLVFMLVFLVYCIIPGLPLSGMLLDKSEPTYIGKLFGADSPLSQGFMFLVISVLMVCGFIYGKISRNIKNGIDYSKSFTKTFENTGYIFVLLFFASILYGIIDWTNIATVISTNIIDFIGASNITGIVLIVLTFVSIVFISVLIPTTLTKWNLIAPIYIPLLMRANIAPTFTQTIFLAADSVGKLFSPIYVYLIITIGFIYKYEKNSDANIFSTMKDLMGVILVLALTWLVIIIGWYLLGMPTGIGTAITL